MSPGGLRVRRHCKEKTVFKRMPSEAIGKVFLIRLCSRPTLRLVSEGWFLCMLTSAWAAPADLEF